MVEFITASVFNSPADVITNTINCEGAMGAGLALEVALRHPDLQIDYEERCRQGQVRLGRPYLYPLRDAPYRAVLNFPTKQLWRFPSRLTWIDAGLRYIADHYRHRDCGLQSLALPKLGCDKGGLNWHEVEPLVQQHLGSQADLQVFVCLDTAPAAGLEAEMLAGYEHDHQQAQLPGFIKGKTREALLGAPVPARFRELARIRGVGKLSYARLFGHYQQRPQDGNQMMLPLALLQG